MSSLYNGPFCIADLQRSELMSGKLPSYPHNAFGGHHCIYAMIVNGSIAVESYTSSQSLSFPYLVSAPERAVPSILLFFCTSQASLPLFKNCRLYVAFTRSITWYGQRQGYRIYALQDHGRFRFCGSRREVHSRWSKSGQVKTKTKNIRQAAPTEAEWSIKTCRVLLPVSEAKKTCCDKTNFYPSMKPKE